LCSAGRLLELTAGASALAAFAVFCGLSGAVYLFNDVADRHADQNHPLKRERPIASGTARRLNGLLAPA
jgi:4-hydroxybenzoate polyprenyltransferase